MAVAAERINLRQGAAPVAAAETPATPAVAGEVDRVLAAVVLLLTAFGLVMVYSASTVLAQRQFGSSVYFFSRQSVFALLGTGVLILLSHVPYRLYRKAVYPILLLALAALVAVVGGFGVTIRGATRWIPVGPVNVESSELAKISIVFWLSYSVAKKRELLHTFTIGFVPHALMGTAMAALCLLQPDFGSAMIILFVTFALLFASGARIAYLLGGLLAALPIVYGLVVSSPYRYARFLGFLDPWTTREGAGYQLVNSLMGFGTGGLLGVGIGESRQKLLFLPDAHNDFISAIVGEELGFVGLLALIALFGVLVYRGYRIAVRCPDPFGSHLAFGLTTLIGLQAVLNLGVAMGSLPTKGLTLPFVSYGGSALLVHMAAAGVLLDISRHAERPSAAEREEGGRGTG
jgi:cell division protein FtsW